MLGLEHDAGTPKWRENKSHLNQHQNSSQLFNFRPILEWRMTNEPSGRGDFDCTWRFIHRRRSDKGIACFGWMCSAWSRKGCNKLIFLIPKCTYVRQGPGRSWTWYSLFGSLNLGWKNPLTSAHLSRLVDSVTLLRRSDRKPLVPPEVKILK